MEHGPKRLTWEVLMFGWFKRRKLQKEVALALSDGRLDQEEVRRLRSQSVDLGLSTEDLTIVVNKHFDAAVAHIRERVQSTRRFSFQDEEEILEIAKRFNAVA